MAFAGRDYPAGGCSNGRFSVARYARFVDTFVPPD
jgi:hypothetical protein